MRPTVCIKEGSLVNQKCYVRAEDLENCCHLCDYNPFKVKNMTKTLTGKKIVFDSFSVNEESIEDFGEIIKPEEDVRGYNVGSSDYSKYKIQPWDIWLEYKLNPWDADIIKRVLRKKKTDNRRLDYEKIIHVAKERIRQIDAGE